MLTTAQAAPALRLPAGPKGQHAAALDALARALRDATDGGRRVPCLDGDGGPWLSEDHELAAEAARACRACPALEPCLAAGKFERAGVWGGRARGMPRPAPVQPAPAQDRGAAARAVKPVCLVLLATATKQLTLAELKTEAEGFTGNPAPDRRLRQVLAQLRAAGLVQRHPGRLLSYSATTDGQEAAEAALSELEGTP